MAQAGVHKIEPGKVSGKILGTVVATAAVTPAALIALVMATGGFPSD